MASGERASGERKPEYDLQWAADVAVAASRPVADESAGVIRHVLSEMQRTGREFPGDADESTRELFGSAQAIYREILERLDGARYFPLREINAVNFVLFGRTGVGKSSLVEAISQVQRARYGVARLWRWSNVPALESLIVQAIRHNAEDPRLDRLAQRAQGALTAVDEQDAIDTTMAKRRV